MNCRFCKTEINEDEINNYDKTMCKKCKNEYNKNRLIKLSQNINHDDEKKCTKCNILKDINDFRIGRNICKKCNNKAGNLNKSNNKKPNIVEKPIITTKICSKCEIEKPVEDFYKQYGDIYKSECKICSIKYREEYVKTLKGYTKDNVCLICWEFNIFDKSLLYKNNDQNIGWTKEKFKLFYKNIRSIT